MSSTFKRLPAPAKLNLFLHVVGRAPSGYHHLQTVFQFIDLYDYLSFTRRTNGAISVTVPGHPELENADNLIVRAAQRLQQATGCTWGVHIQCEKHIPLGAGLGGGSSNAATTLIALNQLWQTGLSRAELIQLGLELGADVPVFLFGRPAFAEGVGEQLQTVAATPGSFLLFTPDIFVSTAQVFTDPYLTRNTPEVSIYDFVDWHDALLLELKQGIRPNPSNESLIAANGQVRLFGHNDLQAVALRQHPRLAALTDSLKSQGISVKVSGSGSSVFALFATSKAANRQHEQFQDRILFGIPAKPGVNVRSWVCTSLVEHPLFHWLD